MAEHDRSGTRNSVMQRWSEGRTLLRWNVSSPAGKRTFEEDLDLFERQVRAEVRRRDTRT